MNSKVFLEKQYYLSYLSYLLSGVVSYKSKNAVLNIFLKIYSVWGSLMVIMLLPMDITTFFLADPEKVSYPQLLIGLFFRIPTVSKVIFFKVVKKKYETLMYSLEYETLYSEDEEVLNTFQTEKDACHKFNKIYTLTVFISSLFFTAPAIVVALYNILGNNSDKLFKVELAFPLSLPYNMDTAIGYATGALHMFIQIEMATLVLIGTDTLVAGLMITVVGHLKCLAKSFSIIQARKDTANQANRKAEDEFKKAIEYLQRIYKGHHDLENLQNLMLLTQYLCSIAVLAVGLYRNSKDFKVDIILLKSCGLFIIVLFEPFLFCYFGDMITREAENVKTALYESDWIGSRIGYQRLVLLTLTRLNRPMIFTCGKLIALSNSAFLTIVNTSYSAFNLMKRSNQF